VETGSYLYQWVVDLSVICSILGLIWTAVVWWETKKIGSDFLVRARIPDMVKELKSEVKSLIAALAEWESHGEHVKASESISALKGILLSLRLKVSKSDLKQVEVVIGMIESRSSFHSCLSSDESKSHAWRLSQEANTLAVLLGQLEKDNRWT